VIWNGLEVGSIGLQVGAGGHTFWRWSIDDNGAPCREITTMGDTIGRDDAMAAFRAAWNEYAADPDRLRHMIEVKVDTAERMKRWGPGTGDTDRE
jgi:hypothetical protein